MNTSSLSRNTAESTPIAAWDGSASCYPCSQNHTCSLSLRRTFCELGVICCRYGPWTVHSSVCEVSSVVCKTPCAIYYASGKTLISTANNNIKKLFKWRAGYHAVGITKTLILENEWG